MTYIHKTKFKKKFLKILLWPCDGEDFIIKKQNELTIKEKLSNFGLIIKIEFF